MGQQLGWDRISTQHPRRDRESDNHLQMGGVIADPQISRRTLVESVEDLGQLAAVQLSPLPPFERLCNGKESSAEILFVCRSRVLSEEAFDSLRRVSHMLSLYTAVERGRHHAVGSARYLERRPLGRFVRRADLATRTSPSRASFTASAVGKAAAFLGLRTTTFDLAARRAAYFPRVKPAGKSERLYDRRSSSLSWDLAFFIKPTFWACRPPGADDMDDHCCPISSDAPSLAGVSR